MTIYLTVFLKGMQEVCKFAKKLYIHFYLDGDIYSGGDAQQSPRFRKEEEGHLNNHLRCDSFAAENLCGLILNYSGSPTVCHFVLW